MSASHDHSGLTRRRLLGTGIAAAISAPAVGLRSASAAAAPAAPPAPPTRPRSGDQALAKLVVGNGRFVAGHPRHARVDGVRRAELAQGQDPFAIVLSCADSRVPPELVFDQGLGELFVVRVAGNTAAAPAIVGSIEYAAEHLGSVLLMVLGHERCGAVAAAVAKVTEGARAGGKIDDVVAPIVPAVEAVRRRSPSAAKDALLEPSIRENVRRTVEALTREAPLSNLVARGKLKVVGAEYRLHTGKVDLL